MKMMKKVSFIAVIFFFLMAFFMAGMGLNSAMAVEKITVAYFPGWPLPFEAGWAKGWFNKKLGVEVNFQEFDTGPKMAAAMVSGDVQISYSLGAIPFTIAANQGVPFQLIGIAVSYAEADNCVAKNNSGIKTPQDLVGKKVGVPFGSVSQYKLLGTLKHFGVDQKKIKIYDMAPQDSVAAFMRGDIDCGCAWEPALSKMIDLGGHLIISAKDQEKWGLKVFDIIVVTNKFAKNHPDLVTKFLEVSDESIRYFYAHPEESYGLIGKKAGITPEKTKQIMEKMKFLVKKEQLSPEWLGTTEKKGYVPQFLKGVADFLVSQKVIDSALNDYAPFVNPGFYEAVK